jgi:flagellar hook assembly protein FlgD
MNGQRAPDGNYHVSFKAGSDDKPVPVDTYVHGRVTGVRFDQGYPELMVGDKRLRLSDVVEVTDDGGV